MLPGRPATILDGDCHARGNRHGAHTLPRLAPQRRRPGAGLLLAALLAVAGAAPADEGLSFSLAMHGEAAWPDGIEAPLPWVAPAAPKGGALRLARVGTFDSMNPFIVFGSPAAGLDLVYQRLMYRSPDEPFTLYPQIARAIELAADRSAITFHLDPDARFQDGSPIGAADVLFTFHALLEDGKPHTQTYYAGVREARAVDDRTVRFDLEPGNWELPLLLALMPVLSADYFQAVPFARTSLEAPLGSGPYLVAGIEPGHRVLYRRDPDYWGAHLPQSQGRFNFEQVEYVWYRDANVAHLAFLAGDIDVAFETDALRWATGYDSPAVAEGDIVLEEVAHGRPSGLFAVAWNQRRRPFQDRRVREALGLAFDFAWTNRNLLHGAYERTTSLFGNSPLAARGPATGGELALLAPWRDALAPELFEAPFAWPQANGDLRPALRQARKLLAEAGFALDDGVLTGADGVPLSFELLLVDPARERLMLPWLAHLERLGVKASLRTVDAAQYRSRIAAFDFDAILWRWGVSLSPGNEQWIYWGSQAADSQGSRNYAGIRDPVLDSLIAALADARTADDLVAAARALDRVLMWGRHMLPLWHRNRDNLARWQTIAHPPRHPLYGVDPTTWWREE